MSKTNNVSKVTEADVNAALLDFSKASFEAYDSAAVRDNKAVEAGKGMTALLGKDWLNFPTFKLEKAEGKPAKQVLYNKLRIQMQLDQTERMIAKYGKDDKGLPLRGNPADAWSQMKRAYKDSLAKPKAKGTQASQPAGRAQKRTESQTFRDAAVEFRKAISYNTVHTKNGKLDDFQRESAALVAQLCELAEKHKVPASPTKAKK